MLSALYPLNWTVLAREIKEANHWQCQDCGLQCRRPGEFYIGWQYELTVAHYDHVYEASDVLLVALCVKCHLLHDAPFGWRARRRAQRFRRLRAGQLEIRYPQR